MSYALYFWRETAAQTDSTDALCNRLCEDEEVEGIAALPVAQLKSRFAQEFPGVEDNLTELNWEGAGSHFEVSWSPSSMPDYTLLVIVDCGYLLLRSPETMDRIVILLGEFGCAVYDPQTGERTRQPLPKGA